MNILMFLLIGAFILLIQKLEIELKIDDGKISFILALRSNINTKK